MGYVRLFLAILFFTTNGYAQTAVQTSIRPEARPSTGVVSSPLPSTDTSLTTSPRPQPRPGTSSTIDSVIADSVSTGTDLGSIRPQPRPETALQRAERLRNEIYQSGWDARDAAAERLGYDQYGDYYLGEAPPIRVQGSDAIIPMTHDAVRKIDRTQLPDNLEEKAYQVSGVTFYDENTASYASGLTGAPIREVWVADDILGKPSARIYNSTAVLNHKRYIAEVKFTSSFVTQDIGGLGRADVVGASGLVSQAEFGVSLAEGTLRDAQNMSTQLGAVRDAAIAEAEKALEEAKEALRLAQEALEKAQKEKEEDEAAEDGDEE